MFTHEELFPGLIRISCPGDVYAYLAIGEERAALIDTGLGFGSLKAYVEELTSLPLTVILTHGHLDHAGGAGEFDRVYIDKADLELALAHSKLDVRLSYLPKEERGGAKALAVVELLREQCSFLEEAQRFELGGITLCILPLCGHTHGSVCVLFEELRTVLLGDACNSFGFLQLDESLELPVYKQSLERLSSYKNMYDKVIFSHPHNFGDPSIIPATITLCDEIIRGKRTGVPYEWKGDKDSYLLALETDDADRPIDGGCANFAYKKNI